MKLPNAGQAVVDTVKLTDYCLSPEHPRGRHKAYVFAAVLGLTARDADVLEAALRKAAVMHDAVPADSDQYGLRYTIDFEMFRRGRAAIIRSAWIVRAGESFPRFTSCYILERKTR